MLYGDGLCRREGVFRVLGGQVLEQVERLGRGLPVHRVGREHAVEATLQDHLSLGWSVAVLHSTFLHQLYI